MRYLDRSALANAVVAATLLGACQDAPVSRAVGARCDRSAECDERCLAPGEDWPGGFCTVTCDSDGDCPEDTVCIVEGEAGVCAFRCDTDPGCAFLGNGYECSARPRNMSEMTVTVCHG